MNTFYVSDLDGRLLGDNAILSSFSKKILDELLHQGLQFTVASARSVVSMQVMLKGLNLRLPIIEFNGAFLSDLDSGRHEIINSICPSVVESIYKLILEFGCVPFVSSFNGTEDCVYYID
ncbi:HAD family hydrolase [Nostoc sp.]|uniref:HAD family hydrolase n=1 Tax=Nostoc sp. TaxID=1180 RepID=UPI002FFBC304